MHYSAGLGCGLLAVLCRRVGTCLATTCECAHHALYRMGQIQPCFGICRDGGVGFSGLSRSGVGGVGWAAGLWLGLDVAYSLTPTRQAEWADVLADVVGLVLAWGAWAGRSMSGAVRLREPDNKEKMKC